MESEEEEPFTVKSGRLSGFTNSREVKSLIKTFLT